MSLTGDLPLVIGHRGASGYRPEHSELAYRLACELGADAVEPDIVVTSDGVLVVRHENEISGTTDVADHPEFASRRTIKVVDGEEHTGWFTEDFTWAELATLRCVERLAELRPESASFSGSEAILRLSDVLRILDEESGARGREIAVVLEVKHAEYFRSIGVDLADLLVSELAACGWSDRPGRVIVESFELGVIERLQAAGLGASYIFLNEAEGSAADEAVRAAETGETARDYAWYRSDAGLDYLSTRVDGISVDKVSLISDGGTASNLPERAHARGLRVFTWTLRPENAFLSPSFRSSEVATEWGNWAAEFVLILESGVDGIFVDHTDLGVTARAEAHAAQS